MTRTKKVVVGIAIGIVVCGLLVIALGFWAEKKAQTFFYPFAPPMPPIVSESMPEILAHLELVLKTNAPQVLATLQPGISSNQIGQLEQRYNVQIPEDIKAIYEWHDGARTTTGSFANFIPGHRFVSLEDMLDEKAAEAKAEATVTPAQRAVTRVFTGYRDNWYCLFDDGASDGYFFDPTRKPTEGAIFSTFTEEGYFLFFPSAKNLMAGIAECYEKGAYRIKTSGPPLQLDEDFDQSTKIWKEFGANNEELPSSD